VAAHCESGFHFVPPAPYLQASHGY
jgi:hypothetical protein